MDASIIKLLDGTKVNTHQVIDNLSRKALAWRPFEHLEPETTEVNLVEALENANVSQDLCRVVMDSGFKDVNSGISGPVSSELIERILAHVQVDFSNSIVEAFWRSAKYQWLFLNELRAVADVQRLVAFFVEQHNTVPHSSFKGQTPNERYDGTGDDVVINLAQARAKARRDRLAKNRASHCSSCPKAA